MKKVFLSMLAVAALAACSNDDNNVTDNDLVPIRLGAGVDIEVTSKAPVIPGPSATQVVAGIYRADEKVSTTLTFTPTSTSPVEATLGTAWFYPNDGSTVNMYAWHPNEEVPLEGEDVTFTTKDGTIDVMYATASGTKENTIYPQIGADFFYRDGR